LKQIYSSAKKLDCFYRDQTNKNKNKQKTNTQHENDLVSIDDDNDDVEKLNGESSDNEEDDYLFENSGSL